jgi:dolichyl-phosphate-mannose-protein mannosyltransferase
MPTLVRSLNRPIVAIIAVAAIAGGIRLWGLSQPADLVFDEIYYAKAGCVFIGGTDEVCRVESDDEHYWVENKWDMGSWVHPPLGKWMTGMGVKAFGMDAFGWRLPSAVSGTLVAIMVALIAQLLFAKPAWTFVAGTLIAMDGLNVVMSRLAMLDVHLELWVVLGFLCLVLDRRWIDRRTAVKEVEPPAMPDDPSAEDSPLDTSGLEAPPRRSPPVPSPLWRPWRIAAGVAFGAGIAVKWSGITALAAAVLLTLLWETTRRHRGNISRPRAFARTLGMETLGMVLAFVLIPTLVYMAAWLPWFNHFGFDLGAWWDNHEAIWRYHDGLTEFAHDSKTNTFTPTHGSYSEAWSWVLLRRPVNFYVLDVGDQIRQILAVGNPALFWGSVWALPYAAWSWWRRRDWMAGFVTVAFLGMWLPWFAVSRPEFLFYVLPLTPFMVLATVYTLRDLSEARLVVREDTGEVAIDPETGGPAISSRRPYRSIVWIYLVLFVALFVWFWPLYVGAQIPDSLWRLHIWLPTWN